MSVGDLECVEDMALVCVSMNALEGILRALDASCLGMGLIISSKRTKILMVHPTTLSNTPPRTVHLGGAIAQDCLLDWDSDRPISKAANAFCSLYRVATLLHGSETWVLV